MKDKNIESIFSKQTELAPSVNLKEQILSRITPEIESRKQENQKPSFFSRAKKWIALAVCFVVCFVVAGGLFGASITENHVVYVDINPSVSLSVNAFGNVTSANFINQDAENTFDKELLEGEKIENVLERIIVTCEDKGFIGADTQIYISISSKNQKKGKKMLEKLKDKAQNLCKENGCKINTAEITKEEKELAESVGVSANKYRLICEIIEKNPQYTLNDLRNLSMKELRKLLKDK